MTPSAETPLVFISHSQADAERANQMEKMLHKIDVATWNFNSDVQAGDSYLEKVKPVLLNCTHIMVLVGPMTKDSRWVDMEMEIAMSSRDSGPGAGLIGVILPNHDDFDRPYYEPSRVPVRLHDLVSRDVAMIKKWTEDQKELHSWLQKSQALRHFSQRKTRPSLTTLRFINEHAWTNEGDVERAELFSLSDQHLQDR